jgi:selenide,water dikinase
MAPDALAQVLRPLAEMFPAERYADLLVGLRPSDDAAVYRLTDELALIATVDFITPVVDDAYEFGAVAAANALSDVYAMGGEVALALNVCCFPECLGATMIAEILRGGAEKVAEAGGVLVGGHTVEDQEPKYGLVALGFVHPTRILTKSGARPGDVLILTKRLGVGIITTAFKADQARPEHIAAAVDSMRRLNRGASERVQAAGAHACTDVTGFGLLGHACEVAERSGVRLRFDARRIPWLAGAQESAEQWLFPAGTARNRSAYAGQVHFADGIAEETQQLLFTPETSGGLIASVPPERADGLVAAFREAGEEVWVVGEVQAGGGLPWIEVGP